MFNPEELAPPCVNRFLLDGDENVIPGLSSGKRDKIHSKFISYLYVCGCTVIFCDCVSIENVLRTNL